MSIYEKIQNLKKEINFDETVFLSESQIRVFLQIGNNTFSDWIDNGKFPGPDKTQNKICYWNGKTFQEWIDSHFCKKINKHRGTIRNKHQTQEAIMPEKPKYHIFYDGTFIKELFEENEALAFAKKVAECPQNCGSVSLIERENNSSVTLYQFNEGKIVFSHKAEKLREEAAARRNERSRNDFVRFFDGHICERHDGLQNFKNIIIGYFERAKYQRNISAAEKFFDNYIKDVKKQININKE